MSTHLDGRCNPQQHQMARRSLLKAAGLGGLTWLTPLGEMLAYQAEKKSLADDQAQSVIILWMAGGASQLETFDPHPGTEIGGPTTARHTSVKGIQIASGLEQVAEQMEHLAVIRSVLSKEGDHERGTYTLKTGYRPDPTAVHPSVGAILCHQLPEQMPGLPGPTEIPRHVSILPGQWPARGGFLGDQYDAFKTWDPKNKVPDVSAWVDEKRYEKRLKSLDVVESAFARGRTRAVERTMHRQTMAAARQMMTSDQLKAFSVEDEPRELLQAYGDTPFGRGCLAARRLTEVGVRCVEVTLNGWDSHANNFELQKGNIEILDPAFATLIQDLKDRDRLKNTLVVWMGEFGRTPRINRLDGRDHWPSGFSIVMAGAGVRGGQVIGATNPNGPQDVKQPADAVESPVEVGDIHASILAAAGIDHTIENISRVNRPIALASGKPIPGLLRDA